MIDSGAISTIGIDTITDDWQLRADDSAAISTLDIDTITDDWQLRTEDDDAAAISTIDIDTITNDWQLRTASSYVDWSEIRLDDPMDRKERFDFAGCTLASNPALAENSPLDDNFSGKITLAQSPDGGPVWIKANLQGMPEENRGYAFAINEFAWNGIDCASSGGHWHPTSEVLGIAESGSSHVGDLL